ncbi:hypothetical protein JTE90_002771 [Oedothorax gibbosus]|uniref:Uncharacterized protein n=1 Tax=Oedothorax gibbosus TaxID=931172 RepID=A0AAV6TQ68_9ARAC|nr:hypothetical protein JTE90_002771 [Oedothorax gibbosus]
MSFLGEDSHLDEEEDILSEEASDENEDNISLDDAGSDSDLDDDSLDSDIDEGDHSEHLFTGAKDNSIYVVDLQSNSIFRKFGRPDGSPVYTILPIDDYIMARQFMIQNGRPRK